LTRKKKSHIFAARKRGREERVRGKKKPAKINKK
jgi:hypothetical protein